MGVRKDSICFSLDFVSQRSRSILTIGQNFLYKRAGDERAGRTVIRDISAAPVVAFRWRRMR